jgi:hypothetical protein
MIPNPIQQLSNIRDITNKSNALHAISIDSIITKALKNNIKARMLDAAQGELP